MTFNVKLKQGDPILLPIYDQHDTITGYALLPKSSIVSVFYNPNTGQMVINVMQTSLQIGSRLLLAEEIKPRLENGNLVPGANGQPQTMPSGKYRNDVYINGSGGNEQLIITKEEDIKVFWKWYGAPQDVNVLLDSRREYLEKLEKMREEAKQLHEARMKEQEAKLQEKLKGTDDANPLSKVPDPVDIPDNSDIKAGPATTERQAPGPVDQGHVDRG